MRIIAVTNLKGGVGKTTTAVNLAHGLASAGQRVLLVDADGQGHCAIYLGVERTDGLCQVLLRTRQGGEPSRAFAPTAQFIQKDVRPGLDLLSCDPTVAIAERLIASETMRELRLARRLAEVDSDYDVCLIDVGPKTDLLSNLALLASDYALVVAMPGTPDASLNDLTDRLSAMLEDADRAPVILGITPTTVDSRERLSRELMEKLSEVGELAAPAVRRAVAIAESTRAGQTIMEFRPGSGGALDYAALTQWTIARLEAL